MNLGGRYYEDDELATAGFKRLGRQVRIHDRASVYGTANISLGSHVRIDDFSIVIATGLVEIGDYVSIPNFCFLGGTCGLRLDDFVTLAPGVKLFSSSDDYLGGKLTGPVVPRELTGGRQGRVHLQRHVLIGAGSVVLPGCVIGEGTSVGALSLVTRDLEPWGVYAGIPAVKLKDRSRALLDDAQRVHRE